MDLKAIRDHLCLARLALGPEQPLSVRIRMVERNLTPGDPLWRNDAISAQTDLLAISTELEQLPKVYRRALGRARRESPNVLRLKFHLV